MATRLYYQANTAAPVSPAFGSGYASTAEAVRRNLVSAQEATVETLSGTLTGAANDNDLIVQLVSAPLAGDQTITGTYSLVSSGREGASTDNIRKRWRRVAVVSNDGNTVRSEILAPSATASTTELTSGAVFQGQQHASGGAVGTVNALDGDRIVIELGYGSDVTGTTPAWEMHLGGTGTDHANANGDTTGTVPWSEFSQNLTFQSPSNPGVLAGTLGGITADVNVTSEDNAVLAGALGGITADLAGTAGGSASGPLAGTLGAVTADLNAAAEDNAVLAGNLSGITADINALSEDNATVAGTLQGIAADLNAVSETQGPLAGQLGVVAADLNGTAGATDSSGPLIGTLGSITADLNAVSEDNAALVGGLSGITADINAAASGTGVLAGILQGFTADLNGGETGLTTRATSAPMVATSKASASSAGASNTAGAAVSSSRSSSSTVTGR